MNLNKECRAQISMETLILVGVAVIVALSVGLYIKGLATHSTGPVINNATHETIHAFS